MFDQRRALLILVSLISTFVITRVYLHFYPDSDLNIGPYNIHHLFTGLILITFCGIAIALFNKRTPLLDVTTVGFGIGLSLALDEWVYLIATDGSNASYLLPISFWGGITMVGLACLYISLLLLLNRR